MINLIKKLILPLGFVLICFLILNEIPQAHAQPYQESQVMQNNSKQISILVDVHRCKMLVFKGSEVVKTYTVAVGTKDTPSPIGNWKVSFKSMNWGSGFGARFMGLDVTWGKYGIHGTNKPWSIGSKASHGCIRMKDDDVIELYSMVQPGTPVIISGNPFVCLNTRTTLHHGHRGSPVVIIQQALQRFGYYKGSCDGIFGYSTERALKDFQKDYKLQITGQVNEPDFEALGL